MYTTGLSSYNRYHRPDDRYVINNSECSWNNDAMSTPSSNSRRTRYTRSSTTSVAQLLSESCTTLLQKLTTKVRGPSEASTTRTTKSFNPLTTSKSTATIINLGSTRTRLEDKYSSVLDKIYGRKRDIEKTVEPSIGRNLAKSATTSNVLLSEKSYPFVGTNSVINREKTPYRSDGKSHHYHKKQYQEPPYAYLDQDSAYRVRYRSNHSELRPRRSSKPLLRAGKSELNDRNLKLYSIEINDIVPVHTNQNYDDDEKTPTNTPPDPLISEREAKRKEIQSLIMKYSALDEVYNRGACAVNGGAIATSSSSSSSSSTAAVPNLITPKYNSSTAIAKKYCPSSRLVAVVSKEPVCPS